jgi:hypothetical protein
MASDCHPSTFLIRIWPKASRAASGCGRPLRADAADLCQPLWMSLDDLEGLLAEERHDALGHGRADAAHVAQGEVLLDPLSPVGGVTFSISALNCKPCWRSVNQMPVAVTHSPAPMAGACPTRVTRSRLPRACTLSTQKPVSALWKVTRSTVPASVSLGGPAGD